LARYARAPYAFNLFNGQQLMADSVLR